METLSVSSALLDWREEERLISKPMVFKSFA